MMLLGVTGHPILHSRSPQLFSTLPGVRYLRLAATSPVHALALAEALGLVGMNVTAPFKEALPLVTTASASAAEVGALNTIRFHRDDHGCHTSADNTDVHGIVAALGPAAAGQNAVVLGAGGAARAAIVALARLGCPTVLLARRPERADFAESYGALVGSLAQASEVLRWGQIVVDCLGTDERVLPAALWRPEHTLLSARYAGQNAHRDDARTAGATLISGEVWLTEQARAAAAFMLGTTPLRLGAPVAAAKPGALVLVGASGAGKTSLGAVLAQRSGRRLYDVDQLIEQEAGNTISTIFAEQGEATFRALEQQVIQRCVGDENAVIVTGGGAVVDPRTRALLAEAGTVLWLWCSLEESLRRLASTTDRPLLGDDHGAALERLRQERHLFYAEISDLVLDSTDATPDELATRIFDEMDHAFGAAWRR